MKRKISALLAVVFALVLVLTACTPTVYTVTFDAQNGSAPTTVKFDGSFQLPATPQNGNKVFGGWYTDAQCTIPWTVPQTLTGNITVYAKWTEPSVTTGYNVVFDAQNGTSPIIVPFDSNFQLPATPQNGDKVFGGWYTDAQCTTPWTVPETLTGNIVVYAKWTEPSGGGQGTPADLSEVFSQYDSYDKWNFQTQFSVYLDGELSYSDTLKLYGDDVAMTYEYEGVFYTDYLEYRAELDGYFYYYDNGDGTYEVIDETDSLFMEYYSMIDYVELTTLGNYQFVQEGDHYSAVSPVDAGNAVLGEYEDSTWTALKVYVSDGKIVKIVGEQTDVSADYAGEYTYEVVFSNYGKASFTLPDDGSGSQGGDGGGGQGGGSQGGGSGEATQLTSVFLDQYLTVANGCLQYTTGSTANSFDDNRGVQFLQNGGVVTIVSSSNVDGVTVVSVTAATNCTTGMQVQVSVGTTPLKCEGETLVTVAQQSHYTQLTTLNFVADEAVSGAITVILTPTAASKSMYISSIAVNGKVGGGGQGGDGGSQGGVSGNVMPQQTYDANTFDSDNLQDKLLAYDGSIGLPSTGNIDCLVVPVQFSDTQAITSADLEKLNKAFNGTAADTGWQSVSSYYALSSYNKLNLNYDIWGVNIGTRGNVFTASHDSTYYNNYNQTVDVGDYTYTQYGDEVILLEVLEWLEGQIDLTKYDTNNDGCIDAVYLIYSADVDYQSDSSIYWAYVTWYSGNRQFDGIDAYYYLFAGFDFMDEDADRADGTEYSGTIEGLNINASTYIHETGHLMGLDDYYDYDMTVGSGEGLGGADIMDYTVGDHGVYSKIMLGWITPTVVTESKTFTIEPSTTSGDCLLVMLDFDNSYFSEYLLIDLYSATGLNALHASQANSYLYDGASYGVRIYHVSSSVNNPYSDEYGSFTDNNNTYSSIPLIKLVEADGENKFAGTRGYASESDLWQTGEVFSRVFPMYTRNDGKLVNFDITVDSVSQTSATVTITFQAE